MGFSLVQIDSEVYWRTEVEPSAISTLLFLFFCWFNLILFLL